MGIDSVTIAKRNRTYEKMSGHEGQLVPTGKEKV